MSVLADVLSLLVSIQWLAHIQSTFSQPSVRIGRIVGVVVDDNSERRIAHALVHFDGVFIAFSYKEVHEPGILGVASFFQSLGQELTIS